MNRDYSKIKYFLYARKSSESEDRQMASIQDQINAVTKIAKTHKINVVEIFLEEKSAKAPGRPVFNEMISRIAKGEAQGILCWKLNRLARNPVDGGNISWMLQRGTIKHIQCSNGDYKPEDNVLMMQVEFGMANQFIKDLSTDVRRGMLSKAQRGWSPSPNIMLGYRHNKQGHGAVFGKEIIHDHKTMPHVKHLWKLLLTGTYSIPDLIEESFKIGLKNKKGANYSRNTFYRIFSSEFYCGYFYWQNDNGETVRYQGKHEPIISYKEWQRAQIIIGNRTVSDRSKSYDFKFRGFLRCGECNSAITADRKIQVRCSNCSQKFSAKHRDNCNYCHLKIADMQNPSKLDKTYYRCSNARKCKQPSITEKELLRQYRTFLNGIKLPNDLFQYLLDRIQQYNDPEKENDAFRQKEIAKQIKKLESRLMNLVELRADGEIDHQAYASAKEKAERKIEELSIDIATDENATYDWKRIALNYLKLSQVSSNILDSEDFSLVKSFLASLSPNQNVKDKKLCIYKPKPILLVQDLIKYPSSYKGVTEPKLTLNNKTTMRICTHSSAMWAIGRDVRTVFLDFIKESLEQDCSLPLIFPAGLNEYVDH